MLLGSAFGSRLATGEEGEGRYLERDGVEVLGLQPVRLLVLSLLCERAATQLGYSRGLGGLEGSYLGCPGVSLGGEDGEGLLVGEEAGLVFARVELADGRQDGREGRGGGLTRTLMV